MDDAVILALVTLFAAAVPDEVYDGPNPTSENAAKVVMVGVSEGVDDATFDASATRPEESTVAECDTESGEVACMSYAFNGDGNLAAARAAAKTNRDLCVAALRADRTLGGLLIGGGRARVTGWSLRQAQTSSGAEARYSFNVAYYSLLTS